MRKANLRSALQGTDVELKSGALRNRLINTRLSYPVILANIARVKHDIEDNRRLGGEKEEKSYMKSFK